MKHNTISLFFFFCSLPMLANYQSRIEQIPAEIKSQMIGKSWKPNCPVPLDDLRYVTVSFWGYDNQEHEGHLIVHKKVAQDIVEIFAELFEARFPIERMKLIDEYNANDDLSMADNNSSAFCSRENTTYPGVFSNHSYGLAIDINPLVNPYVKGNRVLPEEGRAYLDRTQDFRGIITENSVVYRAFSSRGWQWGGNCWTDRIDYQHFAKEIDLSK